MNTQTVEFHKVTYVDGTTPRVDAGYRNPADANKRAEILRARGMRGVKVSSYNETRETR